MKCPSWLAALAGMCSRSILRFAVVAARFVTAGVRSAEVARGLLVAAAGLLTFGLTDSLCGQTSPFAQSNVSADYSVTRLPSYTEPAAAWSEPCVECCTDPWRLFPEFGRWTLTGWLDGGVTMNGDSPPSRFNGPMNFNDRNELQFNQLYAALERKLALNGQWDWSGFDWGGRVDALWGTDYIYTQAAGLETRRDNFYLSNNSPHWNQSRFYGLALPQFYGEAGIGDFSMKVGHFYSPIGYEMVQPTGNFFYSHSYTHRFAEPFTNTGALLTFRWYENLTLVAGVVNGWDGFDRRVNVFGGLGGVTYSSNDGRWSLAGFGMSSQEPTTTLAYTPLTMYSLVFTFNVAERLQWVAQHDAGWQKNAQANGQTAEWYSLVNYLYFTLNDCWKAGLRAEWFRDDDGVRVTGVRPGNPNRAPYIGNFYEVSAGLNWTPTHNFRIRPELRGDWFSGTGLPFNDGTRAFQLTAAIDAIFVW